MTKDVHSMLVRLKSTASSDALTAPVLGTERSGNGVMIDDDQMIVTIGHLVTETEGLWITDVNNRTVPGHVVGYDQESGLGLVQALQRLDAQPVEVGNSSMLAIGDSALIVGHGDDNPIVETQLIARAEFAGHWEYLLDEALIISPTHPHWSGAGLISHDHKLLGIGSLLIQTTDDSGNSSDANMIVPIELLTPIFDDLRRYGRPNRSARPWLGFFVYDDDGDLTVANIYDNCPADRAGVHEGDVIIKVADKPIVNLADMYRSIWSLGSAGAVVPMTLMRDCQPIEIEVLSVDRNDQLKAAQLH